MIRIIRHLQSVLICFILELLFIECNIYNNKSTGDDRLFKNNDVFLDIDHNGGKRNIKYNDTSCPEFICATSEDWLLCMRNDTTVVIKATDGKEYFRLNDILGYPYYKRFHQGDIINITHAGALALQHFKDNGVFGIEMRPLCQENRFAMSLGKEKWIKAIFDPEKHSIQFNIQPNKSGKCRLLTLVFDDSPGASQLPVWNNAIRIFQRRDPNADVRLFKNEDIYLDFESDGGAATVMYNAESCPRFSCATSDDWLGSMKNDSVYQTVNDPIGRKCFLFHLQIKNRPNEFHKGDIININQETILPSRFFYKNKALAINLRPLCEENGYSMYMGENNWIKAIFASETHSIRFEVVPNETGIPRVMTLIFYDSYGDPPKPFLNNAIRIFQQGD